ncbi:MAG: EamA family transporter RarD [Gammaproteobacteria bacterium]|nr:EamA family transporter RarD [Gammaproteobacteria bacterium]
MTNRIDKAGVVYATLAYLAWGVFPIYFKALQEVAPLEVLVHRVLWSLGFLLIVLAWQRHFGWLRTVWQQPRLLARFALSAVALSVNWLVYIWSVGVGRVVDASLGYFITPLFSVMLGLIVLHERLRAGQWLALATAALGVIWLTWQTAQLPWIGLVLATSFSLYGLLRKTASLGTLEGLSLETLLLFPVALAFLLYLGDRSALVSGSITTQALLVTVGPITAIPLLLFAAGARRLPLSMIGLLQYIAPTLQLLVGVWLYHEPLSGPKLLGYALIWLALAIYTAEGLWSGRQHQSQSDASRACPPFE